MHEMSIALGIVDIATRSCEVAQRSAVSQIGLEIGPLSGVQIESLDFVWPLAVKGTVLEKAEKVIVRTKGEAKCLECRSSFPVQNHYDNCPECKSYFKEIVSGKELKVKYIEV